MISYFEVVSGVVVQGSQTVIWVLVFAQIALTWPAPVPAVILIAPPTQVDVAQDFEVSFKVVAVLLPLEVPESLAPGLYLVPKVKFAIL
jgi:hypothetical protein